MAPTVKRLNPKLFAVCRVYIFYVKILENTGMKKEKILV